MKNPLLTSAGIERHLKKGHGRGHGETYKPWLEVRHVPSLGKSSRVVGWKTKRIHSFLSQLELRSFYLFDWEDDIIDIREQFPLIPQENTKEIAHILGVNHPKEPKATTEMIMTTDFVITLKDGSEHARCIKYAQDLEDPRTVDKLEIERLFWEQNHIDWKIITEKEVDVTFAKNIEWLHPKKEFSSLNPISQQEMDLVRKTIESEIFAGFRPLNEIASEADETLGYRPGSALSIIRHLLANKTWKTDMTTKIEPNHQIQITTHETTKERSIQVA